MKYKYLHCFASLSLALLIMGSLYGFLFAVFYVMDLDRHVSVQDILSAIGMIFSISLIIFLFFLLPLIFASLVRWALQRFKHLANIINFLIFNLYWYLVAVLNTHKLEERIWGESSRSIDMPYWEVINTFILLLVSEFILSWYKKLKLNSRP